MRVEKQSTVWQPNSMGLFDSTKLKLNNMVIDSLINYLGTNFKKEKLVNLAKIFEKIEDSDNSLLQITFYLCVLVVSYKTFMSRKVF